MIAFLRQRRVRRRIARLTRELRTLDRERTPLAVARICHDLAQLSLAEGQRAEAVRWFGQSVDAYIYAGFTEAATALCARLIRLEPRVIRARATLAMLHLASGRIDDAAEAIRDYVNATRLRGERAEVTEERLLLLASLADDPTVRELIGRSLLELGAVEAGNDILKGIDGPFPALSEHERWRRLLEAALQPPGAVRMLEL